MTLQTAILFGIRASIVLTVFSLGLKVPAQELTFMFRHPAKLLRSLVAMDLIMPLVALLIIVAISPPGPVKIALAALSVSPVPPVLPKKATKAGGVEEYVVGLLVAASLIALAFVPLSVRLLGSILGVEAHVSVSAVAALMAVTVLVPLTVGIIVRKILPGLAEHIAMPSAQISGVLLILCALPVLFGAWHQMMVLIGNGTLVAFAAFVLTGLTVGHFIGGPDHDDRTVLAIATASRHPGIAMAIAAASFPAQKLVVPAVILYLIVSMAVSLPYMFWRKRNLIRRNVQAT